MTDEWVVLLEARGDADSGAIDPREPRLLLEALDGSGYGGALHCPDRYALQVTTAGPGPAEALVDVVSRWADAVRRLDLPARKIVRVELLTPDELETDLSSADGEDSVLPGEPAQGDHDEHEDVGRQLLRQVFSDPLTGLLSREVIAHRLDAALARAGDQRKVAVVCLDLDGFGTFNDHFSGATGDHMLIVIAQRLSSMLRPGDAVARYGGDVFAVVLEDTTEEAARAVAGRMLDAVRRPIDLHGQEFRLSASVGVALSQPGDRSQAVIGNTEAALTLAKAAGGGHEVVYRPEGAPAAQVLREFGTGALQDRLAHLLLTQEAAVAANEADTLHCAVRAVMRQICAHVGCTVGHLWVSPGAAAPELRPTSLWHMTNAGSAYQEFQKATDELSIRPGVGLPGRVLADGRPVWISDLAADPAFLRRDQATAVGLRSAFAFPVLVGREVVAVLEFFSRSRIEPTGSFLEVVAAIGTQLGRVVERGRAAAALRRSEEQLCASEARLREAQALARLGSWHIDLRANVATWSDEMYSICGLDGRGPSPDLDSIFAIVHSDDRARAHAAFSRLVETGERTSEEVRILRSDGEVRWHRSEGSAIRDETGAVVAIEGTSQDITEQRLADEALREHVRRLAEAQSVAGLGWWERDLSTGRVTWSEGMCRLLGGQPDDQPHHDGFVDSLLLASEARTRQTGEPSGFELRADTADGQQRWFRGRTRLLRDEHGVPPQLFATMQDVTEEKQAEEGLRRAGELYHRIIEMAYNGIVTVDART